MSNHYIYSTLTNDHNYTNFKPQVAPGMALQVESQVLIKGGANRATDPNSNRGRHTPKGVMTVVKDDELEALQRNSTFQRHLKQKLLVVLSSKEDPDDIALDMVPRDAAAPLTEDSPQFQQQGITAIKPEKSLLNKAKSALGFGDEE